MAKFGIGVVFTAFILCSIVCNTNAMEQFKNQQGSNVTSNLIDETNHLLTTLENSSVELRDLKLADIYGQKKLNNTQNIIFNYLQIKHVKDKKEQLHDMNGNIDRDTVIKKLRNIIDYYNHLLEMLFRFVAVDRGKFSNLDVVINNDISEVINHIKLRKDYANSSTKIGGICPEIAEIIQNNAVQDFGAFYTMNKTKSEDYYNSIQNKFSVLTKEYNTFFYDRNDNKTNHLNSISSLEQEKVAHALYLDKVLNKFTINRNNFNNYAYAIVTINHQNSNTILIREKDNIQNVNAPKLGVLDWYYKNTKDFRNIIDNNIKTLEYDVNNLLSFENLTSSNSPIHDLILAYLNSKGRGLIKDDELQILYYLFDNVGEVVTKLPNNKADIDNFKLNIKLFTYMDMCPSCWMAWNECLSELKNRYETEFSKQLKFKSFLLKFNVYSIKPYVLVNNHPFVNGISEKNIDVKIEIQNVNDWSDIEDRNKIRQSVLKFNSTNKQINNNTKSTNDCNIKQIVDLEGVNLLTKMNDTINYLIEPIKPIFILSEVENNETNKINISNANSSNTIEMDGFMLDVGNPYDSDNQDDAKK